MRGHDNHIVLRVRSQHDVSDDLDTAHTQRLLAPEVDGKSRKISSCLFNGYTNRTRSGSTQIDGELRAHVPEKASDGSGSWMMTADSREGGMGEVMVMGLFE